jgi:2'-5' RNA ligase
MRLFVAAYPPASACDDLSERLVGLPVAPRATWHVTIAFLGEVADLRAPSAAEALERAAVGPPVTLRLAGGGSFGRGRSTVLWAGVEGDGLDGLARRVRHELRKTRIPYDDRPFRPHLTVARPGDEPAGAAIRSVLSAYAGPSWPVTEVRLMRSHLGPEPVYDRIAGYPLG